MRERFSCIIRKKFRLRSSLWQIDYCPKVTMQKLSYFFHNSCKIVASILFKKIYYKIKFLQRRVSKLSPLSISTLLAEILVLGLVSLFLNELFNMACLASSL